MQWTKTDISQYIGAKEYIDTLIIPLIPFDVQKDDQLEKQAFQSELLKLFTQEVEKEFKGRILLSPAYFYLAGDMEKEADRISKWIANFKEQPFEHIFLFTFDAQWRKTGKDIDAEVVWLPGMQSGDLTSSETTSFIKEQVSQIAEMIRAYW